MNESTDDDRFRKATELLAPAKPELPTFPVVKLRPMPAPIGAPPESRIGDRLRDARQQLDLSVEALSRLTKVYDQQDGKGISSPTLGRYESGDTTPNLRELRLLSEALDVPVQWLVDGSVSGTQGQQEVQDLIAALLAFVVSATERAREDPKIGSMRLSEAAEWERARKRVAALEESKRPAPKR